MNTTLGVILAVIVVGGLIALIVWAIQNNNNKTNNDQDQDPDAAEELENEERALEDDSVLFIGSRGCPACRAFRPTFGRVPIAINRPFPPFRYLDIARMRNRNEFLRRHGIRHVPYIVRARRGRIVKVFNGPRSVQGIIKFVEDSDRDD
jgi:hypothetical protein